MELSQKVKILRTNLQSRRTADWVIGNLYFELSFDFRARCKDLKEFGYPNLWVTQYAA